MVMVGLEVGVGESPPLVFVFTGESNSGGQALNSAALPVEVAARSSIQILNNTTLAFQALDIGANNNIDHAGLDPALYHGMELGLANHIEAGAFQCRTSVQLIKTGQGGSLISQWNVGGTYWTKFLERVDAANMHPSTQWVVWYSQGINDANGGNPVATWKAATVSHLAKIKAALPGCLILMTEFGSLPGGNATYDTAIQEIAAADPDVVSVAFPGADSDDDYHWSYAGFRNTVVPAMVAATLALGVR